MPAALLLALVASWYAYHPGQAAAGPGLRHPGWRGETVLVCKAPFRVLSFRCVVVRLTDWCQCFAGTPRERIIDLDRRDFARLADPSRGLVNVVVFHGEVRP